MPGGFAIKLLLLLQAKQSTGSQHAGPAAFYSCMEIYPNLLITPRRDLRNNHNLWSPTHNSLSVFHSHKKCCWQSWDTERVWVLLIPYSIITNCALHCLAQALALPKSSWLSRGNPSSHAKESLLHLHSEGQQPKETGHGNVAPLTQKEILVFKGVSGKLVQCNLAPPCNSWIKSTQNTTTVTAISFQKVECSWLRAITLQCWPRLGAHGLREAETSSGWHWGQF